MFICFNYRDCIRIREQTAFVLRNWGCTVIGVVSSVGTELYTINCSCFKTFFLFFLHNFTEFIDIPFLQLKGLIKSKKIFVRTQLVGSVTVGTSFYLLHSIFHRWHGLEYLLLRLEKKIKKLRALIIIYFYYVSRIPGLEGLTQPLI